MKLKIDNIENNNLELSYSKKPENFPILEEMIRLGECIFKSMITIDMKIIRNFDMIEINGSLNMNVEFECSRCLCRFNMPVNSSFVLVFTNDRSMINITDKEKEVTEDEADLLYYSGDEIDLLEPVQEQIVMSMPSWPVCSESCKGLCRQCGSNLNTDPCDCNEVKINPAFEVLAKWGKD